MFIRVPLKPFALEGATIETSVRLDFVRLPATDLDALSHRTFDFALNPDEGYIDGSIYMDGAHHPVDVSKIAFGRAVDDTIHAAFTSVIDFAFEGLSDFGKTPWSFETEIAWTSEAQPA